MKFTTCGRDRQRSTFIISLLITTSNYKIRIFSDLIVGNITVNNTIYNYDINNVDYTLLHIIKIFCFRKKVSLNVIVRFLLPLSAMVSVLKLPGHKPAVTNG